MSRDERQIGEPARPPAAIATRAPAPKPRRLSRKAIVALAASGTCLIGAALAYSLSEGRKVQAPQEQVTLHDGQPDLLASGPSDYSDLANKAAGGIGPPPSSGVEPPPISPQGGQAITPAQDAADRTEDRRRQQAESALASKLFADAGARQGPTSTKIEEPAASVAGSPAPASSSGGSRKASLLSGAPEPRVNSGRVVRQAGEYVVSAGSTISAALITSLSSDLPGQVIAQVTEDVFDSATGGTKLIPQGSRLIGTYDAEVGYGQTRALLVWTRLILPDGRSVDLDRLVGTDGAGKAGITDRIDNHWGNILKAGILSTLLGLGSAASELGEDGTIANAIRDSAGQTIGRAGDRIVEKQLNVQPTITVRPGARVRVLVSRDLVLEPWND